jgi:anhydro-N-acetylmuramic acid kinase
MPAELYHVLGLMSGTSLDGLDLALCRFFRSGKDWHYEIVSAETRPYARDWRTRLSEAHNIGSRELLELHLQYGEFLGKSARAFLDEQGVEVDLVASHGHTVFHQPENRLSFQLGHGQALATASACPVVWDFRQQDVLLGGQGAPLVPLGDRLLFGEYDACLNLGGISNISFERNLQRLAFDICPVNMALNHVSATIGHAFDPEGSIARSGTVNPILFEKLNALPYYLKESPKTLAREWFTAEFLPLIPMDELKPADILATICEHIAFQIAEVCQQHDLTHVLLTGGGALNQFLLESIKGRSKAELILPSPELIEFKEALIFGLLGLLCSLGEDNVLASVTGSSHDHCAGLLSLP